MRRKIFLKIVATILWGVAVIFTGGWLCPVSMGHIAFATEEPAEARTGAERNTVLCSQDPSGYVCEQADLERRIQEAGTTPTSIHLGLIDTEIDSTITIPVGADIEILSAKNDPWGGNQAGIVRGDNFEGTLIQVEKGAKLTFDNYGDGTVYVRSRGEWVSGGGRLIDVSGTLTINGGEFSGVRGASGSNLGAITVRGKDAVFTLNDGKVTDNQRKLNNPGSVQYGAANIAVTDGATFIMNGGEVSYGKAHYSAHSYGEVGGIGVYNGGKVTINDGLITENEGFSGGLQAWTWLWNKTDTNEQNVARTRNYIEINGGTVSKNRAAFSGGGILSWGNSEVTMNDGLIDENSAPNGGGVGTLDLYVWGASHTWQEVDGDGKKWGFAPEEWSEISPGSFTMNGGTISNNFSARTGGGINVVSNAVKLNGGKLVGNEAGMQGGGLYVSTASYTAHVNKALVTENESSGIGGGLWTCPTGTLTLHTLNGAAVFGNTAERYGADIAHDTLGGNSAARIWASDYILGGGTIDYYQDNEANRFDLNMLDLPQDQRPTPEMLKDRTIRNEGFRSVVSAEDIDKAKAAAQLVIQGNKSPRGAGIGTNGAVVFGDWSFYHASITKQWLYEEFHASAENSDAAAADHSQKSISARASDIPVESIKMRLVSATSKDFSDEQIVQEFTLSAQENWSATLTGLPVKNNEDEFYFYKVQEVSDAGEILKEAPLRTSQEILREGKELPARPKITEELPEAWLIADVHNILPVPVDIAVTKKWVYRESSAEVPSEQIPASVTFELVRDTHTDFKNPEILQKFTVTKAEGWKYTISGVPYRNADGAVYVYGLREIESGSIVGDAAAAIVPVLPAGGDSAEVLGVDGALHRSVTVTNEIEPPTPPTPPTPNVDIPKTGSSTAEIFLAGLGLVALGGLILQKKIHGSACKTFRE